MGKGLIPSRNETWWATTFALGPRSYWLTYAADSSSARFFLAYEIGVCGYVPT
jgi:hypothetical protein